MSVTECSPDGWLRIKAKTYPGTSATDILGWRADQRLSLYRRLIQEGEFVSLAAVAAEVRERFLYERSKRTALLRYHWREKEKRKPDILWEHLRKRVPPGPCAYCGVPDAPSVDHILPRSRGGGVWDLSNLARACLQCNGQKRNRTVAEWKAWRRSKGLPWPPVWKPKRVLMVPTGVKP